MKLFNIILFFAFTLFSNVLIAQADSVFITPNQTIVGDQVRVDFPVATFDQIVCLQYTMNYDSDILQFESIGNFNLPDLNESSFGQPVDGIITFSWFDLTTLGVTRADGESIYSVFFSMAGGAGVSDLFIDGSLTEVEACISTGTIPLIFNTISITAFITSNEDIENTASINVFPNPSTDQVTFDASNLSGSVEVRSIIMLVN